PSVTRSFLLRGLWNPVRESRRRTLLPRERYTSACIATARECRPVKAFWKAQSQQLSCLRKQVARGLLDGGHLFGRSGRHKFFNEFLTMLTNSVISRWVLSAHSEQFFEPVFAETCMHGLVGPVKVHIVLAQCVAVGVKQVCSLLLMSDVFRLEEKQ